ncbi:MAG TPA: superoxide dismutase family protein [Sphingomicrobium sp.]|nr:superoxide dismutase family protein [Sphingomicrobium sp.]
MNRILVAAALSAIAACSTSEQEPRSTEPGDAPPSGASLKAADGADAGLVTLSEDGNGVTIKIEAAGLQPGDHGLHLHTVGRCDGPKFESAGPHWNPTGKQHGRDNPAGAHLGDLANLNVAADGRGMTSFTVSGATLKGAQNPLIDLDGAALVVHAKADDYKTDPSGSSGDRIACAILAD